MQEHRYFNAPTWSRQTCLQRGDEVWLQKEGTLMIVNRSAAQLHLENVSAPGEKEKVRRRPTPAQRHSASNWGPGRIAKTVAFAAAAFGQGVQSAVARPRAEPIEGAPGGSAADGKSFCSAAVFNDIPAGPLTSRMSEQDLK
ncbi:MAG TPA: hypothetical protein VFH51_00130, partial [Myxococcota bacterium]|nr:hypothetical protein [Myxococcota bacterium]